jgi:hypothetical protein
MCFELEIFKWGTEDASVLDFNGYCTHFAA